MAFSIDNSSTVKFIAAQLLDSSEESDPTEPRAFRCFGAGRCDIVLELGLVKD